MTLEQQITEILKVQSKLKGQEIATRLGIDKRTVNACLDRNRGKLFLQDSGYRWQMTPSGGSAKGDPQSTSSTAEPETPLATLCRYYLDCLSQDGELDISVLASSTHTPDYLELRSMPLVSEDRSTFDTEAAIRLLNRTRRDRNRTVMYLGYPVRLNHVRSIGWEGFKVEPVCVWTFQENPDSPADWPTITELIPTFNFAILKLLARSGGNFLDDSIQLSDELGIASTNEDLPELDEFFARLRSVRPEWDWLEELDLYNLSHGFPLSELTVPGIYNRAVLLTGERSPYTQGLETELGKLSKLNESQYAGTALGQWLSGKITGLKTPDQEPLVEVLPLNSEQRTAVHLGLTSPLTVITGPPGTGKSQVVTSLLMNAAWRSKKVLFASKNNKAVDVVEVRCNSLGPRPIVLRLGATEYQAKLAEYLDSLLSATATPEDQARFDDRLATHGLLRQRLEQLEGYWAELVTARNRVDTLEQQVEPCRKLLEEPCFSDVRSWNPRTAVPAMRRLKTAFSRANPSDGIIARLSWLFVKQKRLGEFQSAADDMRQFSVGLGTRMPLEPLHEKSLGDWTSFVTDCERKVSAACSTADYFDALERLENVQQPENLAASNKKVLEEINNNSSKLWESWLRLQPNRLSPAERQRLGRYVALLRMILAGDQQQISIKQVFREYYCIFPEVANSLSCWAVTSLSARRLPFEPGFFDLVVIDEASQCDIASALPLLFRAKAATIIGDPKQLRHISGVTGRQDRQLVSKHNLVGDNEHWAYSVNSLFDLSRSLCASDHVVNLRDHHRSHADIINFSNKEFYEGRLRVATRYDRLRRPEGPVVRWVDVKGEVVRPPSGGAVNEEEAHAVVRELKRLVLEQRYSGSIGVVSPFRAQANRIRDLVSQETILEQAVIGQDFLVDTVHRFQGDERDLMIFSPVVSNGMLPSSLSFLRRNSNLFNVAITRARSALITVGDNQAALHCEVDYLSRFAQYAAIQAREEASGFSGALDLGPGYPSVARPELVSSWEHVLYKALYDASLRPIPQYSVEQYLLDFAIVAGSRRLNIEVDGEQYHRNWDGELCRRDQIRNQRLMELGWDVMRFWVYQVRDDLQGCVQRVEKWIALNEEHFADVSH